MGKLRRTRTIVCFAAALLVFVASAPASQAQSLDEINRQLQQKKDAAANTRQQIGGLSAAVQRAESGISLTEEKIKETDGKVSEVQTGIQSTTKDITEKESQLKVLKAQINEAIVDLYSLSARSDLELLFSADSLGDEANQSHYVEAIQVKIGSDYEVVNKLKSDLEKKKSDLEAENARLSQLQEDQKGHLQSLENQKAVNAKLKNNAEGALDNYADDIAKLESQKRALEAAYRNISGGGGRAIGGSDLVTSSASWYLSQDDPRWAKQTIGNTDSTIGRYGCAITSLAMVLRSYGSSITPPDIASNPDYFYNDLIRWPSIEGHALRRSAGADWGLIDETLGGGRPVIAKLSAFGGTHFIVIKSKMDNGKYEILDPISGSRSYGASLVIGAYIYY